MYEQTERKQELKTGRQIATDHGPASATQSLLHDSVAWQRSLELAECIYALTRTFPKDELFGLTAQLRRACVSVASNLAEGKGRLTSGEFAHFLGMARGSLLELETQLHIAVRVGICSQQQIFPALSKADEVRRMLNATLHRVQNAKRPGRP